MNRKDTRLVLRITQAEKKKIEKVALQNKLSASAFCRNAIMKNVEERSEEGSECKTNKEYADIHITIRRDKLAQIEKLAKIKNMSRSKFIELATLKNIVVLDGLKEFVKEINMLGSNINQIVTLCHQGRMKTIDFREFNELLKKIIHYLTKIREEESADNRTSGREKREGSKDIL